MLAGAGYAFAIAAVPVATVWDDGFTLSLFLISAFLCAMASGALASALAARLAGGWVSGSRMTRTLLAGVAFALLSAALAGPAVWLAMSVNMSGFSTATPLAVFNLVSRPEIFIESGIVGVAVLLYTALVGLLLSPLTGAALRYLSGR